MSAKEISLEQAYPRGPNAERKREWAERGRPPPPPPAVPGRGYATTACLWYCHSQTVVDDFPKSSPSPLPLSLPLPRGRITHLLDRARHRVAISDTDRPHCRLGHSGFLTEESPGSQRDSEAGGGSGWCCSSLQGSTGLPLPSPSPSGS